MHPPPSLVFITLLALTASAKKLGINCRGSGQCSGLFLNIASGNAIHDFDMLINNGSVGYPNPHLPGGPLDTSLRVYSGDHIACFENLPGLVGSLCLFMQGNVPAEGVDGYTIGRRIADLNWHGCRLCGSVPLSGDNNPDPMGWLTANYVNEKGCNGMCDGIYAQRTSTSK